MIQWVDRLTEKIKNMIPISLGELGEVVRRKKKLNAEVNEAVNEKKDYTVPNTTEEVPDLDKRSRYMSYALGLIEKENPLYFNILSLRMRGFSVKSLAKFLTSEKGWNITARKVSEVERDAVQFAKAKIDYLRRTGIPILGDPAAN